MTAMSVSRMTELKHTPVLFQVVENLRQKHWGMLVHPQIACERAIRRIVDIYPDYVGALVAVDRFGRHGAAAHGWNFSYAVQTSQMDQFEVVQVPPLEMHPSSQDHRLTALGPIFNDWWEAHGKYRWPFMSSYADVIRSHLTAKHRAAS